METQTVIAMAAILALGSLLQTSAGFGFALFTVPLLVTLGCEPYEAIVLVVICSAAQALIGLFILRGHVSWGRVLAMIAIASAAVPLGVVVLGRLADHDVVMVKRLFGFLVLLALLLLIALRMEPRARLPHGTMVGAMLLSGFMGGLSGMSGPPAVLWVISHRWSNQEIRTTMWALFAGMVPVQMLALRYRFGEPVYDATLLAITLVPAALLGMLPGLWIGHRIPRAWLRRVAMGILAVVALVAMLRP